MSKGPLVRKRPRARNKDGTWRKKRSDAGKKRGKVNVSDPEGYLKFSKGYAAYYFQLHEGSERASRKVVGFGSRMCAAIHLEPSEALNLLTWLEQQRETLEQLAKEQES